MDNKDGNNAFPANWDTPVESQGMSLRDWFAGQALMGMCAFSGRAAGDDGMETVNNRAEQAYAHADAMIAERERKP